jgi:hypothetical protein
MPAPSDATIDDLTAGFKGATKSAPDSDLKPLNDLQFCVVATLLVFEYSMILIKFKHL